MIALFFDTETTGFRSKTFTPEIVQIGAILQDTETRRVLGELNCIIKPLNPIPEHVSAIHGITDDLAARVGVERSFAESIFSQMVSFADVLVAHNIEFDLNIIQGAWPLASSVVGSKTPFCTMRESTNVVRLPAGVYHGKKYRGHKPPKLIEAYAHFFNGASFENAHDAMADVRACRDVYFALMDHKNGSAYG